MKTAIDPARIILTGTALLHVIVALTHARAHFALSVNMLRWQNAYIGLVIFAIPLIAAALVWTAYRRTGALLFAGSMLAAMLFGAYYHFVHHGIDNIMHAPENLWGTLFRQTAVLLAAVQAWGSLAGWWAYRRFAPDRIGGGSAQTG